MSQVRVYWHIKFLVRGFELPKKLDFRRTTLAENVDMLTTMSFFPSIYEIPHGKNLDRSVNPY